ncbi:MAG TPA: helix-turn-helix domain-containing protein [Puia sp.]|jgi:AraC-like DNA-binding protein
MKWQFADKATHGKFLMSIGEPFFQGEGLLNGKKEMMNTLVLNTGPAQQVTIDKVSYTIPADAILPLVANQTFCFEEPETLVVWQFNRDFYCIADHDAEVGCVGFIFYGIEHPFFIRLSPEEKERIARTTTQCREDMQVEDKIQGEMLRTTLKRLIISITRLAKQQTDNYRRQGADRMDAIRQFNLLLEVHFRAQHEVQFYARTMNKSPKTLTNLFGLCNYPPPSELIRRRIILEAKRYLYFTDRSAKEVADNLGFTSAAHFSRFFKSATGMNFSMCKQLA